MNNSYIPLVKIMKSKPTDVSLRRWRALTWINIGIQACFPLAVSFTPTIAAASSLLQKSAPAQTQAYTLTTGETVATVAKKYNISQAELRKLNQFRSFAHGFDHLKAGDELDVPAAPLQVGNGAAPVQPNGDAQAARVAGVASQAGNFLANNPNGEAVASMARGMAMGEATKEVQAWMSQFGTARVQLDVDQHFSMKNSQFDLLIPLYEQQDWLAFTQGSFHRTDSRTQANVGLGVRWYNDGWMLGGNTFLDHDLSRAHSRMGVGVEYWRDYLKLGANSYMRLTNWKDSPDLDEGTYEERPANGWDIRAQAWLPALPQLGGKLVYEQYYGDEVGLFGKDKRQKDPHAFTLGLEYTPVPLVSLSAEQRQGKGSENDTRFGVEMRYQLGVPWQQQVNPDAVQAMRSLAGSRHDLVERNNNIILEYRKKEAISLRTAPLVTGYAGEKKSLGVTVNSSNGVDRIDWSAPALLAAGGKIVQDGPLAYSVVLPDYQFTQGVNNYTVSGVAVDKKGNRSGASETQVSVHTPDIDEKTSTFTPLNSTLSADGKSTQVLTLSVKDAKGNAVDLPQADIHMTVGTLKSATVSAVDKTAAGVYTVTVTAGTDKETVVLTPTVGDVKLDPARVVISGVAPSSTNSTIDINKGSITANGVDSATITFEAKDSNNNPITGIADDITFQVVDKDGNPAPAGTITVSKATEITPPGTYTATLTGEKAGEYTVIPQYDGSAVGNMNDKIELKADETPDAGQGNSTIAAAPKSIAADNAATSTLTFTAKDKKGNPITDLTAVTFVVKDASGNVPTSGITVSTTTNAGNGTYTATLSGTLAGTYTVTPFNNSAAVGSLSDTVTLTAGTTPSGTNSTIGINKGSITANGVDSATITFEAKDSNNNPITGIADDITFQVVDKDGNPAPAGTITVSKATEITPPGTYTATLTGEKAGEYTVIPQYDGSAVGNMNDKIELKADETPDAGQGNSTIAAAPKSIAADNAATSTLTFTAKDKKGNPITDLTAVTFVVKDASGNVPTSGITVSTTTNAGNGTYTATLSGTLAGTYTVTPFNNSAAVGSLSDTVTLTAGTTPSGTNSTIGINKDSITANGVDSATITFEAKDSNNNPIPGIADDITFKVVDKDGNLAPAGTITVSPATEITPPGTYTATLTGEKAGEYTVIPQYNNSAVGDMNDKIELKADETPDAGQGNSTIAAAPKSIAADNAATSTLTFTAKDKKGNPITDLAAVTFVVKDASGNVPTSGITVSTTTNAGNGTYTATLSGTLAGVYTVTPFNNSAAVGTLSDTVTLTAGTTPDATKSTFSADPSAIIPDGQDSTTLTLHLQDSYGNAITGLTNVTFAATPAATASLSTTTDAGNGNYTATMTSTAAGSYTVVPRINGTPISGLSDTVNVATVATDVQDILVNNYTFAKDAGFPKTGFTGAKFTVQLNGGQPDDYTWTSSAPSWAEVGPTGEVTFKTKGNSTPVTITATSKADASKKFEYTFTLNDWYINNGSTSLNWSAADAYCTSQGAALPGIAQLGGSQGISGLYNSRGEVGSLWSEWGNLPTYTGSGFPSSNHTWASEAFSGGNHYNVYLTTGHVNNGPDSYGNYVACRQGL
ncbi:invasin domain 3-containing protein [Serratia marcescens]|uniref:invasin domain 3-containing protein n=2 Tax=Serratia TaxID=613 RepID=UPI0029DE2420|nr:invasin domain 3-containing protein [Serratia marcescens]MDX7274042.1 invasin domain 3-containing protein [Serratia marcescens]